MAKGRANKLGFVLGKFYPPHLGHEYLIRFASHFVDELFVVVEKIPEETIPAELRLSWLQELFPKVNFLLLEDFNPQSPEEHPNFWTIWQSSLLRLLPKGVDYVFASEEYGGPLAEILKAAFIPVDVQRHRFDISGTKVRSEPYRYWHMLTKPVQKYFQKRICICGPESTGKTTLSRWLVEELNGFFPGLCTLVPEYARTHLEHLGEPTESQCIEQIARGQFISETIDVGPIAPVLICDTGVDASLVWNEFLFVGATNSLRELSDRANYDLYLLCCPDVLWVDDGYRYLPDLGELFYERLEVLLQAKLGANVVELKGDWLARNSFALKSCQSLLVDIIPSARTLSGL